MGPDHSSDSGMWHQFLCDGKTWRVTLRIAVQSRQTGLCFRRRGEMRFQAFSRGVLPSDRELQSMSDEVLCALLQRAAPRMQKESSSGTPGVP